jgi:hypothetical protein
LQLLRRRRDVGSSPQRGTAARSRAPPGRIRAACAARARGAAAGRPAPAAARARPTQRKAWQKWRTRPRPGAPRPAGGTWPPRPPRAGAWFARRAASSSLLATLQGKTGRSTTSSEKCSGVRFAASIQAEFRLKFKPWAHSRRADGADFGSCERMTWQ